MTSLLNFIKIYQFIQKLIVGQTHRLEGDLISLLFFPLGREVGKNFQYIFSICKHHIREMWYLDVLFTEGLISAFSATRQTNYVVWGDRSRE
jgi:hypothetical protein